MQKSKKRKNLKKNQKILTIILIIITTVLSILLLFLAWYTFDIQKGVAVQMAECEKVLEETDVTNDNIDIILNLSGTNPEANAIVEKISKHILLPIGDAQVGTIEDADALRETNPFIFQFSKNGDKILSHQYGIIIYDESLDKIVDVIKKPSNFATTTDIIITTNN